MREVYPFKGAIRWAVLPALIVAGGAAVAVVEEYYNPGRRLGLLVSLGVGAAFSFPVGAAMALGRRPAMAILAALLLGGLSLGAGAAVITGLMGLRASFNAGPVNVLALGLTAGIGTMAHHLYLRARTLGTSGAALGVVVYLLASTGGAFLASVLDPQGAEAIAILRRGLVGGLLQWLAMAVALVVAERPAQEFGGIS